MVHAIKAGLLIDGQGGDPIKDAVLLLEGKTITAAGPAASVKIPTGAIITDAADKTVMPGLIDTHVHITYMSASLEQMLNTPRAVSYYQAAINLKRTLHQPIKDDGGNVPVLAPAPDSSLWAYGSIVYDTRRQKYVMFIQEFPSRDMFLTMSDDGLVPPLGEALYYVVTAVNCAGESALGAGRVAADPCP